MSRKSESFSQLYDYLTRDKSSFTFSRNTYANSKDRKEFINEFYNNSKHIKNARGKVFLYHEVLSLEKNNLSTEQQKEILHDLAQMYLYQRAELHLSFGVVHEDKENIHLHLMISANEIEGDKRIRLSKNEFSQVQQAIQRYKNQKYPELEETQHYKKRKDFSKSKQNEQEIKNRGAKSQKTIIKERLQEIFRKAQSYSGLDKSMENNGFELYKRGNNIGVTYNNKNYRLKTLGLEKAYNEMFKFFEQKQEREKNRQSFKELNKKRKARNSYQKTHDKSNFEK